MRKTIISGLLGVFLGVGIVAIAYFFWDKLHIDKVLPRNKVEIIVFFPMLLIAPISATLVHELAHLLTGLTFGQKLKSCIVSLWGIREEGGKFKIFFNNILSWTGLLGGYVEFMPKDVNDINYKVIAYTLIAGPISSLLYAILCLLIFLKFDNLFNSFFAIASLASFYLFFISTIPDKLGVWYTDRKRYQRLTKEGTTQDAEIAFHELIFQREIEGSFKHADISKTYIMEKDKDRLIRFWAEYIRLHYYTDNEMREEKEKSKMNLMGYKKEMTKNDWKYLEIE